MTLKRSITCVLFGAFVSILLVSGSSYAVAPHTVKDRELIKQTKNILKERQKSTQQLSEATKELKKMNASIGGGKTKSDEMTDSLDGTIGGGLEGLSGEGSFSGLTDAKENRFIAPYVSDSLKEKGLNESTQKSAKDMQNFVKENLLPKDDMDDLERQEIVDLALTANRDAAVDAYAVAVAYLAESTKA